MKKHSAILKGVVFMVLVTLSIGVKAVLPPITLPHTFSGSDDWGSIDVNNDGVRDFMVYFDSEFYTSGSGFWDGQCIIGNTLPSSGLATPGISSDNEVLAEELLPPDSSSPVLAYGGPSFTSILDYGDQIGVFPLPGMNWSSDAYIFYMGGYSAPLGGNYTDGKKTGYLGVKFEAADGLHYGWIPITIDDDGEPSVTLGAPGFASTPDQTILAGTGTAVPIPLIASLLGFGAIAGGIFLKRKKIK